MPCVLVRPAHRRGLAVQGPGQEYRAQGAGRVAQRLRRQGSHEPGAGAAAALVQEVLLKQNSGWGLLGVHTASQGFVVGQGVAPGNGKHLSPPPPTTTTTPPHVPCPVDPRTCTCVRAGAPGQQHAGEAEHRQQPHHRHGRQGTCRLPPGKGGTRGDWHRASCCCTSACRALLCAHARARSSGAAVTMAGSYHLLFMQLWHINPGTWTRQYPVRHIPHTYLAAAAHPPVAHPASCVAAGQHGPPCDRHLWLPHGQELAQAAEQHNEGAGRGAAVPVLRAFAPPRRRLAARRSMHS